MKPDQRSFRIAILADRYVNPPAGELDGLAVAAEAGWGVMQLPAADYPDDITARMLAEVAEQLEEFSRHGYDFVVVGECTGLPEAMASVGLPLPDQIMPFSAEYLLSLLKARPAPAGSDWPCLAANAPPGDHPG